MESGHGHGVQEWKPQGQLPLGRGRASCCSRIEHAKWEGPQRAEKGSVSRVTRKAARIQGVGNTDLQAGLSRGLQGMLQGLAEEIIGDGRP